MDPSLIPPPKQLQYVFNPNEGSTLLDHNGRPISVDRLLATKPLRSELSTRPGPGNKKLTYISGDCISRTLNDVFGFDGWNLDISKVQREAATENHGKHTVVYTAQVRLIHKASGAYKEDVGSGDATDRNFGTACSNAIKSSITDAMKRAARHFGDKLGNSLYSGNFSFNKAPISLKDALDKYDIERANSKFGFAKDQVHAQAISASTTANAENIPPLQLKTETKSASPTITRPLSSRGRPFGEANVPADFAQGTPASEQKFMRPSATATTTNNHNCHKRPRSSVNPYATNGRTPR